MKILHLENDLKASKSGPLQLWIDRQKAEVKFIGNAYNSGKEIAKHINWCDTLAFSSTFHYMSAIQGLLQKVLLPLRKMPLTIVIQGYEVSKRIEALVENLAMEWKTEYYDEEGQPVGQFELNEVKADAISYSMRHFLLQELVDYDGTLKTIHALDFRIKREEKRLLFESEYKKDAINRLTGRKIKIGDLRSVVGKEWSELKADAIVDELDMSQIDPRPGWGVWIMGLTEPVKLIGRSDARGYNEYTIVS